MGRLLILIHCLAALGLAATQASPFAKAVLDWRWSHPMPTGNSLISVDFPDSLHGAAVSEKGEVLVTWNGGRAWALRPGRIGTGNLLAAGTWPDGTLIACGAYGRLWKSADSGASWRNTGNVLEALYDVHACGTKTALAVGSGGLILRSGDGGESWKRVRADSMGSALLGVHCGEGPLAFAVGGDGIFLRSQDAGLTWEKRPLPTDVFLNRVIFADSNRGLVATGEGKALTTYDGGRSWKISILDSVTDFRGISWRGKDIILTGSEGNLWISRNDGMDWTRSRTGTNFLMLAAAHVGAAGAIAVGEVGTLLSSRDGGAGWEPYGPGPYVNMTGLAPIAPGQWLAFGMDGLLAKTLDSGKTWTVKDSGTAWYLAGAFRGKLGVVCSYEGNLIHSADAGESWQPAAAPANPGPIYGVDFADAATAVAVGEGGTIWRSVDGGLNWAAVAKADGLADEGLNGIEFHADGSGVIVGDGGMILFSPDKGANWTRVPAPVTTRLYGLAFRDARAGMAVGENGVVLWTRDGGLSWETGSTGFLGEGLLSAAWLNGDTALVHGDSDRAGVIRLTTDRGKTWEALPQPSRWTIWNMKGLGSGKAAFLGERGIILLGTLRSGNGIIRQGGPPVPEPGFSMERMALGARVSVSLPRMARFRITARTVRGKSLGRIFGAELPQGRFTFTLPRVPRMGPTVYTLETEDEGPRFRRSTLLPY